MEYLRKQTDIQLKDQLCYLRLSISGIIRSLELSEVLQCADRIVGQGQSKITIHWSRMSQGRLEVLAMLMIIGVLVPYFLYNTMAVILPQT